ncbi:T9SS type A sorting domain-containing protein [Kaistella sp. G5-32]|uniref:T9SS type A sorting domain-containing protein n=1 Tax=Kaistella gelatinilytica TaxID=2787636 RepID=A0ABS0FBZ1_9FLAO|nr:T9SS type A sorting domain-containing protein [Kaistella gelatinilytica]MBF8457229.1 T9SS type A sorting domain-containing protein [Kaistella gelatinilytica]
MKTSKIYSSLTGRALILLVLLLFTGKAFSQCAYTGTPLTQAGTDLTFCVDTNSIKSASMNAGQYVVLNVIKGFRYTFTVGNVFVNDNENLTLLNAADNSNLGATGFNSGGTGATINLWQATFSGKIKVLLSRGNCVNDGTTGGSITISLMSLGNTQDDQNAFGTDQWIGHVYNWTGGTPPGGSASPSAPAATIPFDAANYVGYYNVPTESFTETFGGDAVCFPVLSAGVNSVNILTQTFAVRYKMRSTKKGCYFLSVAGDDGVRVYVDNVLVFNGWKEQAVATYCNNLIYLKGDSDIILDYYENGGQNVVSFNLTPFNPASNTIAGSLTRTVCSGVSPGLLDASSFTCTGNNGISYQWQISTDNVNFTDIAGATAEDYTPPPVTATTTNNIRYFKRILKTTVSNASACQLDTNVITVITASSTALTVSPVSGNAAQCPALTGQIYSIPGGTNALNFAWTVPTGWNITSGQGTNSISVTTGTSGQNGNISVTASNGCAPNAVSTLAVKVSATNTAGVASSTPTICINTPITNITHTTTGATGITSNGISGANGLPAGISASFATNTITISGTPTVSGTFDYSISLTGGCGAVEAKGRITVTANNTAAAASYNPIICKGTALSPNITIATTGATGIGTPTGLPLGVTASWASNTITLTGAPQESGSFDYSIPLTGGCGSVNAKGSITVNEIIPASVTITVSPTNIICAGAKTPLTFTASPVNGGTAPAYQWNVNGSPVGTNNSQFTSTTLNPNDVVNVILTSNASPCLAASPATSNSITIITQTTIYTGFWTIAPAPNLSAEIRAPYTTTLNGNLDVCSLLVTNNATVAINSGDYFKIQNQVKVDAGSILKIESEANLIQVNDLSVNSGSIISEREFKIGAARVQYNYVGSPVAFEAGQNYRTIFPASTTTVLYHNQANNTFATSSGANIPGRGSAVKEPPVTTVLVGGKTTAQFKGVPQNGYILFGIVNSDINTKTLGYNLVGNPYSSNIDLRKLYDINGGKTDAAQITSLNISPTFYLWDNNTNALFQQQSNSYNGQSYALFNVLTGSNGTGTAAGSLNGGATTGTKIPTKIVKVGQGFMTRSLLSTYNFKFNNSIRTSETSSVDFLGKGNSATPDDRYWLKMTAPSGIASMIAVVYYTGGNNLFGAEDSRSMGNSDGIYSIVENEKTAINGRSAFNTSDTIPLGSQHFVDGNYTIGIEAVEGIFENGQNIYLKDLQTGIITNLSEGNYTFAANAGESTGRFEIIYRPEIFLATNDTTKNQIIVYRDGTDVIIRSPKIISNVNIYDLSGKLMMDMMPNNELTKIDISMVPNGIYILRIKNKDGEIVNRKFIR